MSELARVSMIVMLGSGGLFTGGVAWYAWERVWIWRRLDLREYAVDFRRSVRRADPALPILLVISGVAGSGFAVVSQGAARTLAFAGIGLLGLILVSSVLVAEPINSRFRRRREGDIPPDADRLRRDWRRFHLVRTFLAVAAFAFLLLAVSYA
jgi:Domain of unknown function (DUF1772)